MPKYVALGKKSVLEYAPDINSALYSIHAKSFFTQKYETQNETIAHMKQIIADNPAETYIAVGGDGTLNCLINAVIQSKSDSKIAVIACGSGNAAYWNYHIRQTGGIPFQYKRIKDSLSTIQTGYTQKRDILKVSVNKNDIYTTWASFGYSADVVKQRQEMNSHDYIIPSIKSLFNRENKSLDCILHGIAPNVEIRHNPLIAVFSADVAYFGQGIKISHHAKEGLMAISIYEQNLSEGLSDFFPAWFGQDKSSSRYIALSADISTELSMEGDGELIDDRGPKNVHIKLEREAFALVVGKQI